MDFLGTGLYFSMESLITARHVASHGYPLGNHVQCTGYWRSYVYNADDSLLCSYLVPLCLFDRKSEGKKLYA